MVLLLLFALLAVPASAQESPRPRVLVSSDIGGTDPDGDSLIALITALPDTARVFQTADGVTQGARITAPNTVVTDPQGRVLVEGRDVTRWASYRVARAGVGLVPELMRHLPRPGTTLVALKEADAFVVTQAAVRRGEKRRDVLAFLRCLK